MAHTVKLRTTAFVQAARTARLHSDYALAQAMGVNRSTVTRIIKGDLQPGPVFIASALKALDKDFDELFEIVVFRSSRR